MKFRWSIGIFLFVFSLTQAASAATVLRELGRSPFAIPPIETVEDLKKVVADSPDEIRMGFEMAGYTHLYRAFSQQFPTADIKTIKVNKGEKMLWMFFRKFGKGSVQAAKDVTWAGEEPFDAFQFFIDLGDMRYDIVVPLLGVNFAIRSIHPIPEGKPPPPPPPPPTTDKSGREPPHVIVRTFFATDRNKTGESAPVKMFGTKRAEISYGIADISIPRDHRMGELEAPSIWKLEFREDPAKHVVLMSSQLTDKDQYFQQLSERVRTSELKQAFLFVHGYNVTFEDAARRTAQISYDLAFDGAPVFYSWPSQGSVPAYTVDEQNIEWAQSNVRAFLDDFFTRSEAEHIYLIAHSMGNRALTRALSKFLNEKPTLRSKLQEIILTAPDIDADVFKRDIAPALVKAGRPITLYASSEDKALKASKKVHGYARAGDSGQGLVVISGVETINATKVSTSFLGHSYFAEAKSVLSDIFYLIQTRKRANSRFGLRQVDSASGCYWEFKK